MFKFLMNLFGLNKKQKLKKEMNDEFAYTDAELLERGYVIYNGKNYKLYLNKEKGIAKLISDKHLSEDEIDEILMKHLEED